MYDDEIKKIDDKINQVIELSWIEYRTHTARLAEFFQGANKARAEVGL